MRSFLLVLITAVMTSLLWLGLYISRGGDTLSQLVLKERSLLKLSDGTFVAELPAGIVLHKPGFNDTAYTEPFDPQTFKIYVEFGSHMVLTETFDSFARTAPAPDPVLYIEPAAEKR